ncbi:DUF3486 family protein [bacterium]|nr:DUF3486 family protein [bacterium]
MGKRADMEQDAIRLYAEGYEIPRISEELGVSENSLREWKKRAGSEWDDARAAFRKGMVGSMESVGARVSRAREISDRLTGDVKAQGKLGLGLNQALQTMLYDIFERVETSCVDAETMGATIDQMKGLALILQRTEQAANLNLKREAEIRKQAIEEAAKTVETTAKQAGVTEETIQIIRRDILRMAS